MKALMNLYYPFFFLWMDTCYSLKKNVQFTQKFIFQIKKKEFHDGKERRNGDFYQLTNEEIEFWKKNGYLTLRGVKKKKKKKIKKKSKKLKK